MTETLSTLVHIGRSSKGTEGTLPVPYELVRTPRKDRSLGRKRPMPRLKYSLLPLYCTPPQAQVLGSEYHLMYPPVVPAHLLTS